MKLDLQGLVAAAFTPLEADGSLRPAAIPALVEHLIGDGVAGLYVVGSSGEGVSLSTDERKRAAGAFIEAVRGRVPVIVQVGHNSLAEARSLAEHARKMGADAISAAPPSYFRPSTVDGLIDCLAEVAEGAPELPLYYYHIPELTAVRIDPAELLRRASEPLPSLAGIKYTAPTLDELQHCSSVGDGRFEILYGRDEMLLPALAVGARAAVGSTYNFATPLYARLIEAFRKGDWSEARRCQALAVSMIRTILHHGGNPALKATMRLIGQDCGPCRLPQRSLRENELAALRAALDEVGFFDWARPAQPRNVT